MIEVQQVQPLTDHLVPGLPPQPGAEHPAGGRSDESRLETGPGYQPRSDVN